MLLTAIKPQEVEAKSFARVSYLYKQIQRIPSVVLNVIAAGIVYASSTCDPKRSFTWITNTESKSLVHSFFGKEPLWQRYRRPPFNFAEEHRSPGNTSYDYAFAHLQRQCPPSQELPPVLHLSVTPEADEAGAMKIPSGEIKYADKRPDIPDWHRLLQYTRPIFRTIDHPAEICNAIWEASREEPLQELVIHAHGDAGSIRFQKEELQVFDPLPSHCFEGLVPQARIILSSCSTGGNHFSRDSRYTRDFQSFLNQVTTQHISTQEYSYIDGSLSVSCTWNIAQWLAHLTQREVIAPTGWTAGPPVITPFTNISSNTSWEVELCKYESMFGCETKHFYPTEPSNACISNYNMFSRETIVLPDVLSMLFSSPLSAWFTLRSGAFLLETAGSLGERVVDQISAPIQQCAQKMEWNTLLLVTNTASKTSKRAFHELNTLGRNIGYVMDYPISIVKSITQKVWP